MCETGVYCPKHRRDESIDYDSRRLNSNQRGYDSKWYRARGQFLAKHPICAQCEREGRITPATVVDHIIPHRGDRKLFWDAGNWQPLCKRCHDRKTASGQ